MSGPWEQYQRQPVTIDNDSQQVVQDGPWKRYAGGATGAPPMPPAQPSGDRTQAVTGRTQVPAPRQQDDSTSGFVSGNLNKGIAGLAGLPVDIVSNVVNLAAIPAHVLAGGRRGGAGAFEPPIQQPVGGSAWIEQMMRRGNMVTPSADPESGAGRYAASVLQMLPGAAVGRPTMAQAPRAAGAAITSGLGAEGAADIGGEEWRGVGAMAPGATRMQHKPAGERATAARQAEAFGTARELGIPVPPSSLKPDKAQQGIQNAGNKTLRQPEGTEFTPETLQAYRNAHYGDYEAVMKSPALSRGVTPTPTFQREIQTIGNEIESARANLPETFKGMRPVIKLLSEYGYAQMPQGVQAGQMSIPPRAQPIPPDVAMRAVKKLRSDATTNFSSDKPEKVELAKVQKRLANSVESLIEENLAKTGDQGLMQSFREARTAIAKSHDYQAAMEPGGKINASRLAAMQNEGAPLSGGTRDIAQVAGAFPGAVGKPKDDSMFTQRVSPMAVTHPQAVAAHQIPRMLDRMQMNPLGQAMIDPRGHLTPEQQQMLRYLSAATASNRGIPPPP